MRYLQRLFVVAICLTAGCETGAEALLVDDPAGHVPTAADRADTHSLDIHRSALDDCMAGARVDDPTLAGSITFELNIGGDGSVVEVAVLDDGLGNADAIGCMIRTLRAAMYPPAVGASETYVIIETVHFDPLFDPAQVIPCAL